MELILTNDDWSELLADHSFNTATQDLLEVNVYPEDFTSHTLDVIAHGGMAEVEIDGFVMQVSREMASV
jgi:hypothetical protein